MRASRIASETLVSGIAGWLCVFENRGLVLNSLASYTANETVLLHALEDCSFIVWYQSSDISVPAFMIQRAALLQPQIYFVLTPPHLLSLPHTVLQRLGISL